MDVISIVKNHFEMKGYRVLSGLQFGCELVLYSDDISRVHSDFCVHILDQESRLNWMTLQTLTRSMSDFKKQLIVVNVTPFPVAENRDRDYVVEELAVVSGHAPFRHKRQTKLEVGSQKKIVGKNDII